MTTTQADEKATAEDEGISDMAPGMSKFSTTTSTFFKAIAAGNDTKAQWNAFGLKYAPVMEQYAINRYHATPEEAREAVQESFLSLCKSPKLLRRPPTGHFRFWIVSVLHNKLLNIWREKRTEQANRAAFKPVTDEEIRASEQVIRHAFFRILQEDLYHLLKASRLPDSDLPREEFEIWLARVYENRPRKDLAREHNITERTVTNYVNEVTEFLQRQGDDLFADFQMI